MTMNSQGRPTGTGVDAPSTPTTISGDRGLDHEEKLIFELDHGAVGVDLPNVQISDARLAGGGAAAASACRVSASRK